MAGEMAFTYGVPAGIAGSVSRPLDSEVETIYLGETPPTAYGSALVEDGAGKYIAIAGSNVGADIQGILTRSVPNISGGIDNTFTANTPNATYLNGRLTRGYIRVVCTQGSPVKGGVVYCRIVAATGKAIGDFEATSDSTNSVVVPNAEWALNGKDANNVTELRYSI